MESHHNRASISEIQACHGCERIMINKIYPIGEALKMYSQCHTMTFSGLDKQVGCVPLIGSCISVSLSLSGVSLSGGGCVPRYTSPGAADIRPNTMSCLLPRSAHMEGTFQLGV